MKLLTAFGIHFPFSLLSFVALTAVATAEGLSIDVRDAATPPWLPDEQYVANGCYVSTVAYIAKLRALCPSKEARPVFVRVAGGKLHAVAAIQWGGRRFLRDMYIGIAPLGEDPQLSYEIAVAAWKSSGGYHPYPERHPHSRRERQREVEIAEKLVAFLDPQIIHVQTVKGSIAVLTWKTPEGELAFYEPELGTAVGQSTRSVMVVAQDIFAPSFAQAKSPPIRHSAAAANGQIALNPTDPR